ncbi:MAG: hypothetical protein AB1649_12220, partial [Chloroflexota bacterium]
LWKRKVLRMSLFKERRDWILLILILPLGILFMLLAGQWAINLMPNWRIFADISSKVNPGDYLVTDGLPNSFAPVSSGILTPMPWADSFLTPGAQTTSSSVVPLTVLNPSATPTSPIIASPSPSSTPPTITTTPSSTSSPTGLPPTSPTDPATRTPKPEDPPSATPTSPPPTSTPSATLPPVTSTIDPALMALPTTPSGFNAGLPDGSNASGSDLPDGSYFVLDMSSSPVVVNASPDGNYDLVFYEDENPNGSGEIAMDQVIIGITNDPSGNAYYEVFNWGNGIPDTNTNVNTSTLGLPSAEVDNQIIPTADLYQDPSSPPSPSDPQTGILIDVDQAPSHPPPDTYEYIVVIAPPDTNPNNASDNGQVDSIQVIEVSSPAPP